MQVVSDSDTSSCPKGNCTECGLPHFAVEAGACPQGRMFFAYRSWASRSKNIRPRCARTWTK